MVTGPGYPIPGSKNPTNPGKVSPMAEQGASALSPPEDWPAHPDPILALNRMGSFDWDLDAGLVHMDAQGHQIFDITPEEHDGRPDTLDGWQRNVRFALEVAGLVCERPGGATAMPSTDELAARWGSPGY